MQLNRFGKKIILNHIGIEFQSIFLLKFGIQYMQNPLFDFNLVPNLIKFF